VASWRFRVGTEPDLFPNHWNGTREQYFKHYDITVDAVTRIIPEADIGPGNILNPMREKQKGKAKAAEVEGDGKGWGLDIIDHCATGKNYATGKTGTRMRHFSMSYYDGVGKPSFLEESIQKVRERLARYPQFRDIPLEIGEFGILWDEMRQRLWGNDITEWGASWYAAMGDIIYRNGVVNAFEWTHSTGRLPHPRLHVMRMFEMMADGNRLDVKVIGKAEGRAGAIACSKGDKIYLLLFNHHPLRESEVGNTLSLTIKGRTIANSAAWSMNEWTVDHDHGVWAYEMYRDCAAAGLEPGPKAPLYGGQPNRRFGEEWFHLFGQNKAKYTKLCGFPQTVAGNPVATQGGSITMEFEMPGHSVRLIELVPEKQGTTQ
jgi:xylan 1,4-beta-xylosidase